MVRTAVRYSDVSLKRELLTGYPIGVGSTLFARDEEWAGLQLADVIAGSVARAMKFLGYLTDEVPSGFDGELTRLIADWELIECIWPAVKFTPKDLGTDGPAYSDPFKFYETHFHKP